MATRNKLPASVLLVEGKDDRAVVQSLCKQHEVPIIFSVEPKEGDTKLLEGLPLELRRRGLDRLGVVLDADNDAQARWAAVRRTLQQEGYGDLPRELDVGGAVVSEPDHPRFGVWIMPNNATPGMLEDFAASLIPPDDYLWAYAEAALNGIPQEHRRFRGVERVKAHVHTWLAWQEGPGSPMGQAITKGDLDANAPLAQSFVDWLRRLFIE
jgi:hypothetical protein